MKRQIVLSLIIAVSCFGCAHSVTKDIALANRSAPSRVPAEQQGASEPASRCLELAQDNGILDAHTQQLCNLLEARKNSDSGHPLSPKCQIEGGSIFMMGEALEVGSDCADLGRGGIVVP